MQANQDGNLSDGEFRAAHEFLSREAYLLDNRRYPEWLAMLAPDIHYQVVTENVVASDQAVSCVPLLDETHASLTRRVEQLSNPAYTVAEEPPSAMHHFVTNVWGERQENGVVKVFSNLLIFRGRGFDLEGHYFPVAREDLLSLRNDRWYLLRRQARCAESVIGSRSLTFFF